MSDQLRLLDELSRTIEARIEAAEDLAFVVATGERTLAGHTLEDLEARSRRRTALDLAAAQAALRDSLT